MSMDAYWAKKREERIAELTAEGFSPTEAVVAEEQESALKELQSARNYSMEANMSDYSMASINHAKERLDAAKERVLAAGLELPEW